MLAYHRLIHRQLNSIFKLQVVKVRQGQFAKIFLLLFLLDLCRRALQNELVLANNFLVKFCSLRGRNAFQTDYIRIEFNFFSHHLNRLVFKHVKLIVILASTYRRENSIFDPCRCQKLIVYLFLVSLLILMRLFFFCILLFAVLFEKRRQIDIIKIHQHWSFILLVCAFWYPVDLQDQNVCNFLELYFPRLHRNLLVPTFWTKPSSIN